MSGKKLIGAILGSVTILAPVLTFIADGITRDREMDEIADRVVKRLEEKESDDVRAKEEV